jgi:hypothetical protein
LTSHFPLRIWILFGVGVIILFTTSLFSNIKNSYAHFFGGDIIDIDKYQVTFVPYPSNPVAGSNSTTLNFSVLENNTNISNVYSALTITKKGSGEEEEEEAIAQYPYKLYEFSDITLPFVFNRTGDYAVTLQTRIMGDPKYEAAPLEATFDLSVVSPFQSMLAEMLSNRLILLTIILVPLVGGGAAVYVYVLKRM